MQHSPAIVIVALFASLGVGCQAIAGLDDAVPFASDGGGLAKESCRELDGIVSNGRCYWRAEGGKRSANALEDACPGGHPVSIGADDEVSTVRLLVPLFDEAWIGLRSSGGTSASDFVWLTGESGPYRNWADDYPRAGRGACVVARRDGQWENRNCADALVVICESGLL